MSAGCLDVSLSMSLYTTTSGAKSSIGLSLATFLGECMTCD